MNAELDLIPILDDLMEVESDAAADLTVNEAEAITTRIRQWANSFPVGDVVRAFRGRIWIALAYDSWAEWCECELGGLKLPVPQRREVVSELADAGMSNVAIGDAIGVAEGTVRNDLTSQNYEVDRTTLGQDGRERSHPKPKPSAPEPEPEIVDAEIVDPPRPERKPRRGPLPETARKVTLDLGRMNNRLEKLLADDRFDRNREVIGDQIRPEVKFGLDVLGRLDGEINKKVTDPPVEDVTQYAKTLLAAFNQTFAPHRLQQLHASDRREFLLVMRETIKELEELEGDQSFSGQPKTSGRR